LEMMKKWAFAPASKIIRVTFPVVRPSQPNTLFDFLPDDYLLVIDDRTRTVRRFGGMYEGDNRAITVLVEHGRCQARSQPSTEFSGFQSMQNQTIYVSATPAKRELEWSRQSAGAPLTRPSPIGWERGSEGR